MAELCSTNSNNSPTWGTLDLLRWKVLSERFGGGREFIRRFKDGWVKHNRKEIKYFAIVQNIPPELLAGVAWIEVGGDPQFIDSVAYHIRSFDWSGPKWVDDHLTVTRHHIRLFVTLALLGAVAVFHVIQAKREKRRGHMALHGLWLLALGALWGWKFFV